MKYMLLIYHDEQIWKDRSETERQTIYAEYRQLIEELKANGTYLYGDQLQGCEAAQTVRVRNGEVLVTDGPFAETREQVGGFFMIQAKDEKEAAAVAARIPSARMGTIEVRPVVPATAPATA
jgi:hypothetical protein